VTLFRFLMFACNPFFLSAENKWKLKGLYNRFVWPIWSPYANNISFFVVNGKFSPWFMIGNEFNGFFIKFGTRLFYRFWRFFVGKGKSTWLLITDVLFNDIYVGFKLDIIYGQLFCEINKVGECFDLQKRRVFQYFRW
jgi:hypothetical protein